MTVAGAHTVGAPDGGPGLPGTGWSLEHGDIRIAHFVGLHALQVLPLLTLVLTPRTKDITARIRIAWALSASYVSLFALLLWQALRGQFVTSPDAVTLAAVVTWAALTAAIVGLLKFRSESPRVHAVLY